MAVINPDLVPTIAPGTLFSRFSTDTSLAIRWLVAQDPVYFDVLNRPTGDLAMRQLILAKTLDIINLRLGHQALFPFVIQPQVTSGTSVTDVPLGWIWDMHPSMPKKWENVRLARIKRVSGENESVGSSMIFTGKLRLVFTGNQVGSAIEVSLFQVDYEIDSDLTYQIMPVSIPSNTEESNPIDPGESETIAGWVTFRTLDTAVSEYAEFFEFLAPPTGTIDSSGEYPNPTVYEVVDSQPGGTDDFDTITMVHGTGLLTLSAWNPIPQLDSDIETWLLAFNYPYDVDASLQSATHPTIIVPFAMFREFNIVAPASDRPTGDLTGDYFPVWLSGIERLDAAAEQLRFYFSTFAVDPKSTTPIEFATLDLDRSYQDGRVLPIVPNDNLWPLYSANAEFYQGFGLGHVVLSSKWSATSSEISDFFDLFKTIIDTPPKIGFTETAGRVSSFGISRVPENIPTYGMFEALRGSRFPDYPPNEDNKYVVEADQGLGTSHDFRTEASIPLDRRDNPDIEPIGWTGALTHRVVWLIVDSDGSDHDYLNDVLPRLKILLGRDPAFGDFWWDGTRLKFYNGDSWVG